MDVKKRESLSNIMPESSAEIDELTNAATKIQASFRGHLTRKNQKINTEQDALTKELKRLDTKGSEELDIDLGDPELNKAATKIQASFRGHKTRKEVVPELTNKPTRSQDFKSNK